MPEKGKKEQKKSYNDLKEALAELSPKQEKEKSGGGGLLTAAAGLVGAGVLAKIFAPEFFEKARNFLTDFLKDPKGKIKGIFEGFDIMGKIVNGVKSALDIATNLFLSLFDSVLPNNIKDWIDKTVSDLIQSDTLKEVGEALKTSLEPITKKIKEMVLGIPPIKYLKDVYDAFKLFNETGSDEDLNALLDLLGVPEIKAFLSAGVTQAKDFLSNVTETETFKNAKKVINEKIGELLKAAVTGLVDGLVGIVEYFKPIWKDIVFDARVMFNEIKAGFKQKAKDILKELAQDVNDKLGIFSPMFSQLAPFLLESDMLGTSDEELKKDKLEDFNKVLQSTIGDKSRDDKIEFLKEKADRYKGTEYEDSLFSELDKYKKQELDEKLRDAGMVENEITGSMLVTDKLSAEAKVLENGIGNLPEGYTKGDYIGTMDSLIRQLDDLNETLKDTKKAFDIIDKSDKVDDPSMPRNQLNQNNINNVNNEINVTGGGISDFRAYV